MGGWGEGGGERGRRRWRGKEDHLHMHEAPGTALFPAAAVAGAEEGGGAEREGDLRRGGRLELRLRRTRVSGTEEVVCMARADWLVAGGWV